MAGETMRLRAPSVVADLPSDWSWRQLDEICEGIFDCPHSTPVLSDQGLFIARSQDIRTGVFRIEEAARVSKEIYRERIARAEPRYGDLLYSREGTYFGIAAEVPAGVRVCLGQRMVLLRPKLSSVDFRFLRYWLNSPAMGLYTHGHRDGSVAERLNLPTIRRLPVALPPPVEQHAIAALLGALDDKIELNRQMNETLEATAWLFFKDWFVDFGPTRAKAEGRPAYLALELWQLFPDALDDDDRPVGWEPSTIGQEVRVVGGSTPSTKEPAYWDGEFSWATPKDLSTEQLAKFG